VQPVFDTLKPDSEFGFVHAGPVGAGHFSKMVHNGIEYAIMQAYAEGYELMEASDVVTDVTEVLRSWREGTVIRSWLLDLLVAALDQDAGLSQVAGYAEDSGEGRWTWRRPSTARSRCPAITASLFARFLSRQDESTAMKAIAAMRNQFGGHAVRAGGGKGQVPVRRHHHLLSPHPVVHVTHLSLRDFRSYVEVEVPLERGPTAFVGPNGQGKTNLVEAIDYVATLASHRVATDTPLVRVGGRSGGAARLRRARRPAGAGRDRDRPRRANRARLNRAPLPRTRELLGLLRTVVFSPEDLALVKGDPSDRRRLLDQLLIARAPRMAGVRADYDRVLRQRNTLLRAPPARGGGAPTRGCTPSTPGTSTSPARVPSCWSSGCGWSRCCARWWPVATRASPRRRHRAARSRRWTTSRRPPCRTARRTGSCCGQRCSTSSAGAAVTSSTAG
jgi:hypothetical protein